MRLGGRHLDDEGYAGPFNVDALVTDDGELFASESNVRRTATVVRTRRGPEPSGNTLAFGPARGEGVVLYEDVPPNGHTWRYGTITA